jgi:hypothetical protein
MPAAAITQDVHFQHAPVAANPVAVHIPAAFDHTRPFLLCIFMHGLNTDVPFEAHIAAAIGQMSAATTNAILVAPRFDGNAAGAFGTTQGFAAFIAELAQKLPPLLTPGLPPAEAQAVGAAAAEKARIVLVAFSGGWRPCAAILDGLRHLAAGDTLPKRLVAIQLLDAVYGDVPGSTSSVIAWMTAHGADTVLVNLFNPTTGLHAKAGNTALLAALRPHDAVRDPSTWPALANPLSAGSIAFFAVSTDHLDIPADGPPARPIASLLNRLADRTVVPTS